MTKAKVPIGTIWHDRGHGKKFEVTAVNGHVQLSGVNRADGYKVMSDKSLRNNYKLVALDEKKVEVSTPAMDPPPAPEPAPAPANETPTIESRREKQGAQLVVGSN